MSSAACGKAGCHMKARFFPLMLLALILCLLLTGCEDGQHDAVYDSDALIVQADDRYVYRRSSGTGTSAQQYINTFDHFSGKETLWQIDAAQGTALTLDIETAVTKGSLKLVFVGPDDSVTVLVESLGADGKTAGSYEGTVDLPPGQSRVIAVGKSAEGTYQINLDSIGTAGVIKLPNQTDD